MKRQEKESVSFTDEVLIIAFKTLTVEGFSEIGPSMRFGNHVFRSQ